jgi:hypothetical protein
MKLLLITAMVLMVGCKAVPKKPDVSTAGVSLTSKEIESSVSKADVSNTAASGHVDKALSLNERIDAILAELDK